MSFPFVGDCSPLKHRVMQLSLLTSLLCSSTFLAAATPVLERKPVSKGVYEMAYSPEPAALFVATSQSRKLDKGGVVYRLDPATLQVTQAIHNNLKPFGVAINNKTNTIFLGNTTSSAVTAVDVKTGEVKKERVLDNRPRTEKQRPLAPRELVVDESTDTLYVAGLGPDSVLWVVDGTTLQLRTTIEGLGKAATGLAIDAAASRLYMTNGDNEFLTIDTGSNKIISRNKLDTSGEHFYLNISLDPATDRAFITDSKHPQLLVVDTRTSHILQKIALPVSLAVLFNPTRHEVYVTHREAGKVSVIDANTYQVLHTIETPVHPNSLALSPDGQVLFVTVKQAATREKEATSPDDVVRISFK